MAEDKESLVYSGSNCTFKVFLEEQKNRVGSYSQEHIHGKTAYNLPKIVPFTYSFRQGYRDSV